MLEANNNQQPEKIKIRETRMGRKNVLSIAPNKKSGGSKPPL